MEQNLKDLKKENEVFRDRIEMLIKPLNEERQQGLKALIGLLVNNEIEQEKFCNN